jgi:hypothetical protein
MVEDYPVAALEGDWIGEVDLTLQLVLAPPPQFVMTVASPHFQEHLEHHVCCRLCEPCLNRHS